MVRGGNCEEKEAGGTVGKEIRGGGGGEGTVRRRKQERQWEKRSGEVGEGRKL